MVDFDYLSIARCGFMYADTLGIFRDRPAPQDACNLSAVRMNTGCASMRYVRGGGQVWS
jgi:hypothetical protein